MVGFRGHRFGIKVLVNKKSLFKGMAPPHIVRSEVVETNFGLYVDDEIKNLSACQITSPLTFDALGNALPRYLYLRVIFFALVILFVL